MQSRSASGYGRGAQKDGIDHAKDGCTYADARCRDQSTGDRKRRISRNNPPRVANGLSCHPLILSVQRLGCGLLCCGFRTRPQVSRSFCTTPRLTYLSAEACQRAKLWLLVRWLYIARAHGPPSRRYSFTGLGVVGRNQGRRPRDSVNAREVACEGPFHRAWKDRR
jgi:hypothetical protein